MQRLLVIGIFAWTAFVMIVWISALDTMDASVRNVSSLEMQIAEQDYRIEELRNALNLTNAYAEGTRKLVDALATGGRK